MKKRFLTVAIITTLASSVLFSSCIGSFSLSNKLLSWNETIDNKFVNELVFIVLWIVPAYEVALLADILVLNSVEFWSGENPMEAGVVKEVQGKDGVYTVETLDNGYNIRNEAGDDLDLVYDKESNVWSVVAEGQSTDLLKIEGDNTAIVYVNGEEQKVELSQSGLLAFRQSVANTHYLAAR